MKRTDYLYIKSRRLLEQILNLRAVLSDDTEIVAVITAAIAAMLGKSESSFKIKSIRRSSNWNK